MDWPPGSWTTPSRLDRQAKCAPWCVPWGASTCRTGHLVGSLCRVGGSGRPPYSSELNVKDGMIMLCYFCSQEIGPDDGIEMHHPNKRDHPDWTEAAHSVCHRSYHQSRGHFVVWGKLAPLRGRPGYELAIKAWPAFHRMGGLARARSAKRGSNGCFK